MLKVCHISKKFEDVLALSDVDLSFRRGELTFIVGDSGCGKTTLLQMLGGTDTPTEGSVLFEGEDVFANAARYRAQHVAFVYQDFHLITGLTVTENIALGATVCGNKADPRQLEAQMAALGLSNPAQRAETLSGGEKQRVAVARALLKQADVILADEPTGNLDPANADNIFSLLREIKNDKYVIVVTHDRERARRYGDRVIYLERGSVIREEAPNFSKDDALSPLSHPEPTGQLAYKSRSPVSVLTANNLRRRWGHFLLVALALALAITTLAISFDLQNLGGQVEGNVNMAYLETDMITVEKSPFSNAPTFLPDEIEEIYRQYGASVVVGTFDKWSSFSFSCDDTYARDCSVRFIELTDFFMNRVAANDIEGAFPTSTDEIILAEDAAKKMFAGENAIGKFVTMHNGDGQSKKMLVVGINHTVNPKGEIYCFVPCKAAEDMMADTIKAALRAYVYGFGVWKAEACFLEGNERILYGRMPSAPNEVLLSHTALTIPLHENFPVYTLEQIEAGEVLQESLDEIFGKEFCIESRNYTSRPLRVVGFCILENTDSNEDGVLDKRIGLTSQVWEALHAVYPTGAEFYFESVQAAQEAEIALGQKNFFVDSVATGLRDRVNNWTLLYRVTMFGLSAIMLLILGIVFLTFARMLIAERRNEFAVLRALGASGKQIFALVFCDFLIIYVAAFLLSLLFSGAYPLLFDHFLEELHYIRIGYPIKGLLAVNALFLPVLALFMAPVVRKIIGIMPAELLKSKS